MVTWTFHFIRKPFYKIRKKARHDSGKQKLRLIIMIIYYSLGAN